MEPMNEGSSEKHVDSSAFFAWKFALWVVSSENLHLGFCNALLVGRVSFTWAGWPRSVYATAYEVLSSNSPFETPWWLSSSYNRKHIVIRKHNQVNFISESSSDIYEKYIHRLVSGGLDNRTCEFKSRSRKRLSRYYMGYCVCEIVRLELFCRMSTFW